MPKIPASKFFALYQHGDGTRRSYPESLAGRSISSAVRDAIETVVAASGAAVQSGSLVTARTAFNVGNTAYFGNNYNWLDVVKHSTEWLFSGGSATVTADGWFTGLPAGATARAWLFLDTDNAYGYFPPGQYVIRGAAGFSKTVLAGPGITGITSSATRAFFTVPDVTPHNTAQHSIQLQLTNISGAPNGVTAADPVIVVRVSEEAQLDSGLIWSGIKKSHLGSVAVVRMMDMAGVNLAGDMDHYGYDRPGGTLQTAASRNWSQTPHGCPYDVQARLAVETNKIAWMCFHNPSDGLMFDCDAATNRITPRRGGPGGVWPVFDPGWLEGQRVVFYIAAALTGSGIVPGVAYYIRNPSAGTYQLSTTPSGAILDITATMSPLTGQYGRLSRWWPESEVIDWYASIAAQIRAVYPANRRLIIEPTNEVWNFGFLNGDFCKDVFAVMAGSSNDRGVGYAYGALLLMRGFLQHFRIDEIILAGGFQTDWFENMASALSYVDPGHVVAGWTFGRILEAFGWYTFAPYVTPVNPGTGNPYTSAELVAANAQDWSDATWSALFTGPIAASASAVSGHITSVRAAYPMMRFAGYETGQHVFPTASNPHTTQEAAVQTRFTSYMASASAAAMYESLYQQVHVANNLLTFNHYFDVGGVAGRQYIWHWGLRPNSGSPNNARTDWLESKPGLPTTLGAEVMTAVRAMISGDATTPDNGLADGLIIPSGWGKTFDYERQNIVGSSINGRTGSSPEWLGFHTGTNKTGSNRNLLAEWNRPTSVSGGQYTHLYTTERSDLLNAIRTHDTVRSLMLQVEAFMARSPGAKPVLWYCWHPGNNAGGTAFDPIDSLADVNDFIRYETQTLRLWESLRARINLTAQNKGFAWRLDGCPANMVVAYTLGRACNGTLPGITQGSVAATVAILSSDGGVSLNTAVGRYLLHLTFFAHAFRRSPIGAAFPAGVTATQAASLQQCVFDALRDYINWDEQVPTMQRARTYAAGVADSAAETHLNFPVDGAWIAANTNGRPFYFDAATDTASYGWHSVGGTPVGGKTADTFLYLNSLYSHRFPNEATATHLLRMAQQAPGGGNVFTLAFWWGFQDPYLPPNRSTQAGIPNPHAPTYASSWSGLNSIEWLSIIPDNFEGPNVAPNAINGFGWAYTTRILEIIDAWEINAPNPNRVYSIHGGWYFMNYAQHPRDFDATRKLEWIGRTLGDYQNWLEDMASIVQAARPSLDIRLHRINESTSLALRDTAINTIDWNDLWEDNAPHGTRNMFFLTSIATYIEIYNEKPPAGFVFDVAVDFHPTLMANYQSIVDYIWNALRP